MSINHPELLWRGPQVAETSPEKTRDLTQRSEGFSKDVNLSLLPVSLRTWAWSPHFWNGFGHAIPKAVGMSGYKIGATLSKDSQCSWTVISSISQNVPMAASQGLSEPHSFPLSTPPFPRISLSYECNAGPYLALKGLYRHLRIAAEREEQHKTLYLSPANKLTANG